MSEPIFASTDVPLTMVLSARNRKIISISRLEGQVKLSEIAKRCSITESTALTELKHLESLGLVKEVTHGEKVFERPRKETKEVKLTKGGLDNWMHGGKVSGLSSLKSRWDKLYNVAGGLGYDFCSEDEYKKIEKDLLRGIHLKEIEKKIRKWEKEVGKMAERRDKLFRQPCWNPSS